LDQNKRNNEKHDPRRNAMNEKQREEGEEEEEGEGGGQCAKAGEESYWYEGDAGSKTKSASMSRSDGRESSSHVNSHILS